MSKVYNTVRDCVARCRESSTPFLAIRDYCSQLRANPDWTRQDVEQVETGAWQLLAPLLAEPRVESA
jgi:hypothetical protein